MKISILQENTTSNEKITPKHGLSFYIEINGKKLLVDTGSSDLFVKNASLMNLDLNKIDYCILSHGHIDHAGGIQHFIDLNNNAEIFYGPGAFNGHFVKIFPGLYLNVGVKTPDKKNHLFHEITDSYLITDSIKIINIGNKIAHNPSDNKNLFVKLNNIKSKDEFRDELVALISENNKKLIISSCSHSGLDHILKCLNDNNELGVKNYVFAGMHLFDPITKKTKSINEIERIAENLLSFENTFYFTGHCTGDRAYPILKSIMKDRIERFRTSDTFEF